MFANGNHDNFICKVSPNSEIAYVIKTNMAKDLYWRSCVLCYSIRCFRKIQKKFSRTFPSNCQPNKYDTQIIRITVGEDIFGLFSFYHLHIRHMRG